ncbi:MAG: hypothetical protein R2857_15595 [Vampirovibrionales bacterium]
MTTSTSAYRKALKDNYGELADDHHRLPPGTIGLTTTAHRTRLTNRPSMMTTVTAATLPPVTAMTWSSPSHRHRRHRPANVMT